ncbi:MAG: DUF5131 family protein [Pseudomonadota bacterium]
MGQTTAIEWTDATWNPWRGCLKVSQGCKNCYMYREQNRYGKDPKVVVRAASNTFYQPLKWRDPKKVFTCSWSDWFIEQADEWRDEAWSIIRQTPHLTYQILTKRPENILTRLPNDWGAGYENVWLGVSVESQEYLYRAEMLSKVNSVIRFISYEPALGAVDFSPVLPAFQWLISGGESGYTPRPAKAEWFESVRDQCANFGVAYFHKQNGGSVKVDGSYGGKLLNGKIHHSFPKRTQQSVHPTGGILPLFQALSTPEQNPALGHYPSPPTSG